MMSLVQMSTTSTERIVRQVEMKLDRLVDMVNSGGLGSGSGGASPRSRSRHDGSTGPELLEQLGKILTEGASASSQVEKLQDKVTQ